DDIDRELRDLAVASCIARARDELAEQAIERALAAPRATADEADHRDRGAHAREADREHECRAPPREPRAEQADRGPAEHDREREVQHEAWRGRVERASAQDVLDDQ